MKYLSSLVLLCSVYMVTLLLGLNTATYLLPLMYPPPGQPQVIEPVFSEPESVSSSLTLFAAVLVATGVMLYLLKKKWGLAIRIAMFFSLFMGTLLTLTAILGDWGLYATIPLMAIVAWKSGNPLLMNVALTFTIAGIGALLGASLGLVPSLVLILLLSAYDIVAVFVTKHMVTLARQSKGSYALMFLVPVGERAMGLGAGDVAIPLTFTVSVLASKGIGYAIPTAYGGLLGLVFLFHYLLGKEKVTLPALPPITVGLLIGYGLCALILG